MKNKRIQGALLVMLLVALWALSAEAAVTISKNSLTLQTEETYQLQVFVDGTAATASAWGSSDPSVASVSSSGVVTGQAKGSAVITAMVNGTSVECLVSVVRKSTAVTVRYNVLLLDASSSVKGTPLSREKEAAKRFCSKILNASGNNYMAVVSFNSSAKILCNFTKNIDTLNRSIDNISVKNGTNLNAALTKAGALLSPLPRDPNVIKNVVICSDGLPQTGSKATSGRYKSADHKYYTYANAAYKTDVKLKNKDYFVYALGFFHNSTDKDLVFGKKLMKDLASKDKYYVVRKPEDIDKALGSIAQTITSVTMSQSSITMYVGETYSLNVQVNGTPVKASWKSSNSSIATVNNSGKVTAKKKGTTTVTGTANGKSVTCKVTVKEKKTAAKASIKLNTSAITIYVGKTANLKAAVTGKSKKVTWSTSDKSIVTVNKKGKIKGVKVGKAVVTAKANGLKATCAVTVKIKHPEYSQYFMVKPKKSKYGSKLIDEYGVRLVVNEDAVIKKCAVYIQKTGAQVKRTIACTGTGITYAKYVPYLARNGKIVYDGQSHYKINTYSLSRNSDDIWSRNRNYGLITADLEDANGRQLAVQSTGISGKNTRIFYDLNKMIKWLKK